MKKPVARIVFENYRDELVITADAPVEVLVVDHTWPDRDEPRRVLVKPTVRPADIERHYQSTKRRNRVQQ